MWAKQGNKFATRDIEVDVAHGDEVAKAMADGCPFDLAIHHRRN
jgi:hypothetical protein